MKQPKGSVGIEIDAGRLRLRLPRQIAHGRSRYLYLGLSDTKENRKIARAKAQLIESDIVMERFDTTLARYLPPSYSAGAPTFDLTLDHLWAKYTEFKAHSLSQTTIGIDFRKTKNHIASLPTAKLQEAKKIRQFFLDNLSPDAARRTLMQVQACCRWALNEGLIETNPFDGLPTIKAAKPFRSINPFTRQERSLIIQAFESSEYYSYYTPFVKFLFWTGCRTSEAVGLQWQHIDPSLEFISFEQALVGKIRKDTKTHASRKFPTNKALKELLNSIQPDVWLGGRAVFLSKEELTIDPHNFLNRAWRSVIQELPIKYRPQYNTRHTFITLSLEEGIPVTQVAAWVGNSPKTIWNHYAGLANLFQVPEPEEKFYPKSSQKQEE